LTFQNSTEYNWHGDDKQYSLQENLTKMCKQALDESYKGLSIITDVSYILREVGLKNILKIEEKINDAIKLQPISIICLYAEEIKNDKRINELIANHLEIKEIQ